MSRNILLDTSYKHALAEHDPVGLSPEGTDVVASAENVLHHSMEPRWKKIGGLLLDKVRKHGSPIMHFSGFNAIIYALDASSDIPQEPVET